jgi:hypothetical protein
MASEVGVIMHDGAVAEPTGYSAGKLGERRQLLALGSVVQLPEMMVKCGGGGVVYGGGGRDGDGGGGRAGGGARGGGGGALGGLGGGGLIGGEGGIDGGRLVMRYPPAGTTD